MGFGSLCEIARPGLVIKKIDAVLEIGGDDTEVCARKRIGHATFARGRLPDFSAHDLRCGITSSVTQSGGG